MSTAQKSTPTWHAFISHASEDKEDLVDPLVDLLTRAGARIWYDKMTLQVGDSLSRKIDEGLARSRFGIVVLSPAFLSKRWPEHELRGLVARELAGGKVILPIWHGVTHSQLLEYSPPLADKYALDASGKSLEGLAAALLKAIAPELYEANLRRVHWLNAVARAEVAIVNSSDIRPGPIVHPKLPASILRRARFLRAALFEVFPHSFAWWVGGFQRDLHPENELAWWETLATRYHEFVSQVDLSRRQRQAVFDLLYASGMVGDSVIGASDLLSKIPSESHELLREIVQSDTPPNDLDEAFPTNPLDEGQKADLT